MPKAVRRVPHVHVLPTQAAPSPAGDKRYVDVMAKWHHRVNQLSGSMVLAFKHGPTNQDRAAWAAELKRLAADILVDLPG